jgi:DNA-binding GntR family transcriptional regulator
VTTNDPVGPKTRLATANKPAEIAALIESAIVKGSILPGTVLRQDQLSEELGVSRTPVREALQQLAALGLVTIEPNRGARVRMPSREEISERWLIRSQLEALAGELAVGRITGAQVKRLGSQARRIAKLTELMSRAGSDDERRQAQRDWSLNNAEFHDLVLAAANAPVLTRTVHQMYSIMRAPLTWEPRPQLLEQARLGDVQHMAIVEAFAQRDPVAAELLRQHVRDSLGFVVEVLFANRMNGRRRLLPSATDGSAT